jgi:signal transduction histidine kinase
VRVGELPTVHLAPHFLAEIFENLIGNALEYAGEEGGPIEVGGQRSGQQVRFFVRDHGPGVPETEREKIFEVFFRGSTGSRCEGTGVGLAIVGKIATLCSGWAWVEETPGGGSTFWVELVDTPPSPGAPSSDAFGN